MTDAEQLASNGLGLDAVHKAMLADVATLQGLLHQLQTFLLFTGLNPARPLPDLVLEDAEDRLERLLTIVKGQRQAT